MTTELTALDEMKLLRLKAAHPEHGAVSAEALRGALDLAFRALADKDAEISRLHAELDAMRDVPVEYVTESGLAAAMAAGPDRDDGTVLRCTDGKREAWAWNAAAKEWRQAQ